MSTNRASSSTIDPTGTPAFKRWFDGSKVVDAKGRPLVLYHGTGHDFDTFDPIDTQISWFTKNASYASGYAERHHGDPVVYPVFASIKSPLDLSKFNINATLDVNALADVAGLDYSKLARIAEGFFGDFDSDPKTYDLVNSREFVNLARDAGYDGIIAKEGRAGVTWGAFAPQQIKSAIGNDGGFDPESVSITQSPTPEVHPCDAAPSPTMSTYRSASTIGLEQERAAEDAMRYVNLIAVSPDGQKVVLLTKNRGPENVVGRITFPGGRIDATDLTPVHAAVREANEECGIAVGLLGVVLVNLDVNEKRSLHIFFASTDISEARTMEDEVVHVADIDEAIAYAKAHPERYAGDFLEMLGMVETQIAFLRGKASAATGASTPSAEAPQDSPPPARRPRP